MGELTERGLDVAPGRASDLHGRARQGRQADRLPRRGRRRQGRARESFIHIHVERIDDEARRAEIVQALEQVLAEVRRLRAGLAADAGARRRGHRRAQDQSAAAAGRRDRRGDPVPANGWPPTISPSSACATTRSPATSSELEPVLETGLGVLRAPRRAGAAPRRRAGRRSRRRSAFLNEPKPLIITKANVRVARAPARPLDYIGVKRFDADGKLSANSASSACSPRPPTRARPARSPICAARSTPCCAAPASIRTAIPARRWSTCWRHYPRDELFQIDEDTLYQFALAHPAARRAAARARAGAARPLRPLRLGAGLRAARALQPARARSDRRLSRRGLQGPRLRLLSVLPGRPAGARAFHHRPRRRRRRRIPIAPTLEDAVERDRAHLDRRLRRGACAASRAGQARARCWRATATRSPTAIARPIRRRSRSPTSG